MQLSEILFTCHAVNKSSMDPLLGALELICIILFLLSHTAVQAGPQVQARDQAGEEAEAAGPR